ncbi:IS110 family transposase [Colwellia sp. M166]|mgnify:FL=1|jgi:transposase|uniref:IS110 family transposase n=1 Tax=Colwellia sp. M166 TaxID=2583805 RepID=UPI00211E4249|nr:IS110 family transposase [Colwellia sp. M166]UUO21886.1 IS110 family transposase [Colwellia sp. M166]UUO25264.1 IS110 family transposase [Colwellia sp. M166]|tara:strand:+ start:82 stop:1125 length:1044 start_codon:yes stop_codon:yes gene_type:complete
MKFYTTLHKYYCGIDLHARLLYVCILDEHGNKVVHQKIKADPHQLHKLLKPYIGQVVVGVECMHCWYWVSDFCREINVEFILGHALYMKAIHGGKAKNDKIDSYKIASLMRGGNFPLAYNYPAETRATRDLLRRRTYVMRHGSELKAHVVNTDSQYNLPAQSLNLKNVSARDGLRDYYDDPVVQRMIALDMNILDCYIRELKHVESFIEGKAKEHYGALLNIVRTFPGIGQILALTILYEIGDINRFPSVQQFASYSRLVKCKAESAGKTYGTSGNKIGNGYLKWAFSEAAVLYLRGNDNAKRYLAKLQKRMSKGKALSALAHKIGRCVYFMLRDRQVFDENKFLKG